ncbi:HdeD family acid-resistance protein [Streptomyces sp. HNM0574]|nr:HdeD family acid-resistance protein [Streptomyces sp. HNM0574]
MSDFSPPGDPYGPRSSHGAERVTRPPGPASGDADAGDAGPARERWGPLPDSPLVRLAVRGSWQSLLASGVVALILGVLALVWPGATLLAAGILFGAYLLVSGIVQVVSAFGTRMTTPMRVIGVVSGAVGVLLGLFCFRDELQSVLLLALWIGIGWLFRGITQIAGAAGDPDAPARGWQITLGVVSLLGGLVLLLAPLESITALTIFTGVWLLGLGLAEIVTGLSLRARTRRAG